MIIFLKEVWDKGSPNESVPIKQADRERCNLQERSTGTFERWREA
jgi:hypothetical protein